MQTTSPTLPYPLAPMQTNQTGHSSDTIHNNVELLRLVIDEIEQTGIVDEIEKTHTTGRRGFGKRTLFRSYITKFVMGHKYTNHTIRLLRDNPDVRELCGFSETIPWHTTFTRFFAGLKNYDHLIEAAIIHTVDRLKTELPDLGRIVAIDATAVHTYSNPNRKTLSDPEAKWGVKHTSRGKDGKSTDWFYGYKAHVLSDAIFGIPLANITTKGNGSDTVYLSKIMDKTIESFSWFKPEAVLADRGYDSKKNNNYLWDQGIHPIIRMKRPGGKIKGDDNVVNKLIDGIYDVDGVPHCMGVEKMAYVESDPVKGHKYVCPPGGCHLKDKSSGAMLYCNFDTWEDPTRDIRLFGTIRRASDEWKKLYRMRYSVERSFKSMKQARCLEYHTVRGFDRMNVHILMSLLTAQATVLVNLKHRPKEEMMWMVPRVA